MFRSAFRPLSSFPRRACNTRLLHLVTTDFINYNTSGNLVTRKVPVMIGDPGETYMLIEQEVGSALCATTAANVEYRYKLTFFHDSQHFGFGLTSYPRLYAPSQIPRQTELNTSPATLFIGGKMHHLVLDGTPDGKQSQILPVLRILIYSTYLAIFAEHANDTAQNLVRALYLLKDM
ncbi:hypothetical protein N7527_007669 [Penicillium freii]|nr:hypothetical protein N7527_007669 [Penicillium freii]